MIEQLPLFPYLEAQESPRPADFIPVYTPALDGREEQYVLEAVRSGWISSLGQYVTRFEQQFAEFCAQTAIGSCDYRYFIAHLVFLP